MHRGSIPPLWRSLLDQSLGAMGQRQPGSAEVQTVLWGSSAGPLAHKTTALTTGARSPLSGDARWPRAWGQWHRGSLGLQRDRLYPLWGSSPRSMAHKTIALTTELREPLDGICVQGRARVKHSLANCGNTWSRAPGTAQWANAGAVFVFGQKLSTCRQGRSGAIWSATQLNSSTRAVGNGSSAAGAVHGPFNSGPHRATTCPPLCARPVSLTAPTAGNTTSSLFFVGKPPGFFFAAQQCGARGR